MKIQDKKAKRKIKAKNHLKNKKTEHLGLMRKINKETLIKKYEKEDTTTSKTAY